MTSRLRPAPFVAASIGRDVATVFFRPSPSAPLVYCRSPGTMAPVTRAVLYSIWYRWMFDCVTMFSKAAVVVVVCPTNARVLLQIWPK